MKGNWKSLKMKISKKNVFRKAQKDSRKSQMKKWNEARIIYVGGSTEWRGRPFCIWRKYVNVLA